MEACGQYFDKILFVVAHVLRASIMEISEQNSARTMFVMFAIHSCPVPILYISNKTLSYIVVTSVLVLIYNSNIISFCNRSEQNTAAPKIYGWSMGRKCATATGCVFCARAQTRRKRISSVQRWTITQFTRSQSAFLQTQKLLHIYNHLKTIARKKPVKKKKSWKFQRSELNLNQKVGSG